MHAAAFEFRLEPMLDRVLDQRLQRQRWNAAHSIRSGGTSIVYESRSPILMRRISRYAAINAVSWPSVVRSLRLAASDARSRSIKRSSIRRALSRRAVDQADHIGQRIEQEVRLDLRLQRAQLRVKRLSLQLDNACALASTLGFSLGEPVLVR